MLLYGYCRNERFHINPLLKIKEPQSIRCSNYVAANVCNSGWATTNPAQAWRSCCLPGTHKQDVTVSCDAKNTAQILSDTSSESKYTLKIHPTVSLAVVVPWLRRLVAGLSPRRSGFDPGSVHLGFLVDKVALGQVFPEYFGFPLSISFHRCSIDWKSEKKLIFLFIFITRVAQ
jgi:hypothetical protein